MSDPSEKVVVKDEASLDLEKFELEKEIKGINHGDSFEFENNSQDFEPDNSSMRYELVVEERTRTNKIIEIKGIGPAYKAKLNELNIFTVSDLLDRGTSPEGRKKIAKDANISPRLIIDWVNQADLLEETLDQRIDEHKQGGEELNVGVDDIIEIASGSITSKGFKAKKVLYSLHRSPCFNLAFNSTDTIMDEICRLDASVRD